MEKWTISLLLDRAFWKQDGVVGLLVAFLFLLLTAVGVAKGLEDRLFDVVSRLSPAVPSDKVAVINIDDNSVANLGHWPWSRTVHARMLDILNSAHPKAIAYTPLFPEPQSDDGLSYIYRIAEYIGSPAFHNAIQADRQGELTQLNTLLRDATQNLDHDQRLSDSMVQSSDVVLGMAFDWGEAQGKLSQPLADYISRNGLSNVQNQEAGVKQPFSAKGVAPPIPALGGAALAIGHVNVLPDRDGVVRSDPLVVRYYDQYYPSLSLILAAKSLNLESKDIQVRLGEGVRLGNQFLSTDGNLRLRTHYYKTLEGGPAFMGDSFYDVYSGKILPERYRDKIVLIGVSASGTGASYNTTLSRNMPTATVLANNLSSILKNDCYVTPAWGKWLEQALFIALLGYLVFILPRLSTPVDWSVTAVLLVTLLVFYVVLLLTQNIWLQLAMPALLLLSGHVMLYAKRRFVSVGQAQHPGRDESGNNRVLGLALQGQGQLDLAFDKLRKVTPVDDALKEVLYNLALDFERKRQYAKAESVFKYIAKHDVHFRDLSQRISQSHTLWDTLILGAGARHRRAPSSLLVEGAKKPMLGRYEIDKELGKGTMGVVYRGRDTKIGRVVAIKTVSFSQDFEEDELQEMTMRFLREIETVGRLNHPNIVSIYDVGEELDLSYIAMEFLNGHNLEQYTSPEKLLPLPLVVSIIAQVADALDYAHKHDVVHRDIKPANIMFDPGAGVPKVTDFGIARITNSSQTKTGMVFGTPSYMSPEQLAGRKIQGASDLFSLGTTLYQLACGKLPFEGESMAQLMYAIANQPHADILTVRTDVPPCLSSIINKALAKKVEDRFATCAQLAAALRACAAATWPDGGV